MTMLTNGGRKEKQAALYRALKLAYAIGKFGDCFMMKQCMLQWLYNCKENMDTCLHPLQPSKVDHSKFTFPSALRES